MTERKLNRREFMERAMVLGLAASGMGATLMACSAPKRDGGEAKAAGGEAPKPAAAALNCTDVSGLSDGEKKGREMNKYIEISATAGKNCANCALYEDKGPDACGGCKVVKGPINPKGYCTLWVAKQG